jgi:tetratricopeptide (TPR) repeat protein
LIFNRIASMHSTAGDHQRAIDLHSRALTLAGKAKNNALEAATHASLGRIHMLLGNENAARPELQAALLLYEQLGDKRGQANALLSMGKLEISFGQDLVRSAAALFQDIGDKAGEEAANLLLPSVEEGVPHETGTQVVKDKLA